MAMYFEIDKFVGAPMEEVLLKLYPVAVLKWLYDVNLRDLAEAYAGTLPQPDYPQPSDQDKAPKKAYLIQLLLAVLQDKAIRQQFFESLPQQTWLVIAALTWARRENLAALEKTLGQQIAVPNPDERRSYYEPFLLPEHGFVVIVKKDENYWSYSSTREKAKKEDYCLQFTKSDRVVMPSLKLLRQMTGGPEFFESSDDRDLALLRSRLQCARRYCRCRKSGSPLASARSNS
jgi:hypothetical protein